MAISFYYDHRNLLNRYPIRMHENQWRFNGFEDPPTLESRTKSDRTSSYNIKTRKSVWQQRHRELIAEAINISYDAFVNYLGYYPTPTWTENLIIPLKIRNGRWYDTKIFTPRRKLIRFGCPHYEVLADGFKKKATWEKEFAEDSSDKTLDDVSYFDIQHSNPPSAKISIRVESNTTPTLPELRDKYHCFIGLSTDEQVNIITSQSRELQREYEQIKEISDNVYRYEFQIPAWDMINIQNLWNEFLSDTDIIHDDIDDYVGADRPVYAVRVTFPLPLSTATTSIPSKEAFHITIGNNDIAGGAKDHSAIADVMVSNNFDRKGVLTFLLDNIGNVEGEVDIFYTKSLSTNPLIVSDGGSITHVKDDFAIDLQDPLGQYDNENEYTKDDTDIEALYFDWDVHPALGGDVDSGNDEFFEFFVLEITTQDAAKLLYYPDPSNSSETAVQEVAVTPYIINGERGEFGLINKTITGQYGQPYAVKVSYQEGLELNNRGEMNADIERAIFMLTNNTVALKYVQTSSSPEILPFSERAGELFLQDKEKIWDHDYKVDLNYVNPLGLHYGHFMAWKTIQRKADRVKSSVSNWL